MSDSNLIDAIRAKEIDDEQLEQFLAGLVSPEKVENNTENNDRPEEKTPYQYDRINDRHDDRKKSVPNLNELTFVRLIDPVHIPTYLVDQIKGRLFSVDKFYQYQKIACTVPTPDGPSLNGANMLYAITNERLRQVKGFLWMVIDYLTNSLVVNNFSIDRAYWNRGESTKLLEEKAKKVMSDLKLDRIVWITKNPRFCEDKGFKRSKETIMIYEG